MPKRSARGAKSANSKKRKLDTDAYANLPPQAQKLKKVKRQIKVKFNDMITFEKKKPLVAKVKMGKSFQKLFDAWTSQQENLDENLKKIISIHLIADGTTSQDLMSELDSDLAVVLAKHLQPDQLQEILDRDSDADPPEYIEFEIRFNFTVTFKVEDNDGNKSKICSSHGNEKIKTFMERELRNYIMVQFTDMEPPGNTDSMSEGVTFLKQQMDGEHKEMTFLNFFHKYCSDETDNPEFNWKKFEMIAYKFKSGG